jgi:hypothetical protein
MEEKRQVSTEKTEGGEVVTEKKTTSAIPEGSKGGFQAYYLVYYVLGVLEILLAFRFVFKLLGASSVSGFVSFIYSLSGPFVTPFSGIFSTATTTGVNATAVLEPATIIAMIVYAILGWGIGKLITISMAGKS